MTALLIDTCTEHGLVAFYNNDRLLYQGEIPVGFHNSKYMALEIDKGLKQLAAAVKELKYIAVTIGPGSYTGIRVGVMAAKTLAYAGGVPLVSLTSLDAFISEEDALFAALIDAKIGGAYLRIGKQEGGIVEWLSQPRLCPFEELGDSLSGVETIVTPNAKGIRNKIEKSYPQLSLSWTELPPNVSYLMKCAEEKYSQGHCTSVNHLEILYLRKTQAEIEREK